MKGFDPHQFDPVQSQLQVGELIALLATRETLGERADVLPFFRNRRHLAALLGQYSSEIVRTDLVAYEYDLFGDFTCDIVVGDMQKHAYLLIELEEGGPESVFVSRGRSTPEWSGRFDHGFSQIVDWLYKLADMRHTAAFEERFGSRDASFSTLLVVGRKSAMARREQARLAWRKQKVIVDSKHVWCRTFDELADDLQFRFAALAKPEDSQ